MSERSSRCLIVVFAHALKRLNPDTDALQLLLPELRQRLDHENLSRQQQQLSPSDSKDHGSASSVVAVADGDAEMDQESTQEHSSSTGLGSSAQYAEDVSGFSRAPTGVVLNRRHYISLWHAGCYHNQQQLLGHFGVHTFPQLRFATPGAVTPQVMAASPSQLVDCDAEMRRKPGTGKRSVMNRKPAEQPAEPAGKRARKAAVKPEMLPSEAMDALIE